MAETPRGTPAAAKKLQEQVLRIEKSWWKIANTREQAIRKELGISPLRYYMILSKLLDDADFYWQDPQLVDRLRALRRGRLAERGQEGGK